MSNEQVLDIPVDELIPFVHQSRTEFDEASLIALAADIKANGQLQPGVAWLDPGRGKYVLLCGERRWRALKLAAISTMAVKVIGGHMTQGEMLAINLSENLQRCSLNPVERARSFKRLAQLENLTSRQVAERMHVSDALVSRDLALLDLSPTLLDRVSKGVLAASVAYELSKLADPAAQLELADAVAANSLTRDGVAEEVRTRTGNGRRTTTKGGRICCRLKGGISVTVTKAEQPLAKADLQLAIERLRKEASTLHEGSQELTVSGSAVEE